MPASHRDTLWSRLEPIRHKRTDRQSVRFVLRTSQSIGAQIVNATRFFSHNELTVPRQLTDRLPSSVKIGTLASRSG